MAGAADRPGDSMPAASKNPGAVSESRKSPRLLWARFRERAALIREDPRYGDVVCRCEQVSEGEILEAIRRGARSVDGVKRRVRAGMGRCQGGFCTPRALEILARELGISPDERPLPVRQLGGPGDGPADGVKIGPRGRPQGTGDPIRRVPANGRGVRPGRWRFLPGSWAFRRTRCARTGPAPGF